jgi:hypothetical protein
LRFFFRVTLRRSDIIEHTTFVHEPRKLRPGRESNMLSPQLGDLPGARGTSFMGGGIRTFTLADILGNAGRPPITARSLATLREE